MSRENDERILKLKKQIEEKKENLKNKTIRFTPITNCILEVDGERYNVHALNKERLIPILVKLTSYFEIAKNLNLADEYMIGGFKISDWITDLEAKLKYLKFEEEMKNLKAMEDKLIKMLSSDKQVELELDKIEEALK